MNCRRCIIKGRVQGVSFRAATRQRALSLGVCGWVTNLADGSVEVLLHGNASQLAEMEKWLWNGPALAHVSDVVCVTEVCSGFSTFEIR